MFEGSRGRVVLTALLAALLVAGAAGVAVAQDGNGTSTATPTETPTPTDNESENATIVNDVETGPFTLEELRNGGELAGGDAPPSTRQMGRYGSLWLKYAPASLGGSSDRPSTWRYVRPGQEIQRSEVHLGGFTGWEGDGTELTVKIVYWTDGEVVRETSDGELYRERAAVNQTVDSQTINLGPGYSRDTIDLRPSYDEPKQVTIWVEGAQGEKQWQIQMHTTRTAEPVSVDTRGGLATVLVAFLAATVLATLALMYLARRKHRKAGAGPQYPVWLYGIVMFMGAFFALIFGYRKVLNTVAEAPWVLIPPVAVLCTLAAIAWWGDDTRSVAVIDVDLRDVDVREDGSGEIPVGINTFELAEVAGKEGVVVPGISQYLARANGAIPVVDKGGDPDVGFPGVGKYDEVFFADPFDPDPISYESEGWSFEKLWNPPEDGALQDAEAGAIEQLLELLASVGWVSVAIVAAAVSVGWFIGSVAFATGLLGSFVGLFSGLLFVGKPVKGKSVWNLAPASFGSVIEVMLATGEEFEKLADREYFKEQYYEERGKNVAERKKERESAELSRFDKVWQELDIEELEDVLDEDELERLEARDGTRSGVADD